MRSWKLLLITAVAIALLRCGFGPTLFAQKKQQAPSTPSDHLTIRSYDGKTLTLGRDDLSAFSHKSITVFNMHSKANETYAGVPLSELLSKVGIPAGEQVKGALFMTGVIAEGTDGYKVLFSLAETDPTIHTGDVIVADSMNGQKLDADGAFKLVSSEDKRPPRWVSQSHGGFGGKGNSVTRDSSEVVTVTYSYRGCHSSFIQTRRRDACRHPSIFGHEK